MRATRVGPGQGQAAVGALQRNSIKRELLVFMVLAALLAAIVGAAVMLRRSARTTEALPLSAAGTTTVSMTNARAGHTATLLEGAACRRSSAPAYCGKVLVAGGYTSEQAPQRAVSSAELFDPSSGSWSAATPMHQARRSQTATQLSDGRVLVAGGSTVKTPSDATTPEQDLASAEVYDPTSNSWALVGSLNEPRSGGSAVALDGPACRQPLPAPYCGQVLLVSERYSTTVALSPSAELFDPRAGVWTPTRALAVPPTPPNALLTNPIALLLDGERCHGATPPSYCGQVLAIVSGTVATLYDPVSASWRPAAALPGPRHAFSATLLPQGTVLVTGGRDAKPDSQTLPKVDEIYDPQLGTWRLTTSTLNSPRLHHTTTVLQGGSCGPYCGQALAVGGGASPELYDPATSTWDRARSRLTATRFQHATTLLADGRMLVTGGVMPTPDGKSVKPTALGEVWDPNPALPPPSSQPNTWGATGQLAHARMRHTVTVLGGKPCKSASPPSYCGKVLVAGGDQAGSAELYDPAAGRWSTTGRLVVARSEHTATLLPDGKVLVAGGQLGTHGKAPETAAAELYDPVSGSWSLTAPLATGRFGHTATLLPNGKVLVAGGATKADLTVPIATVELYDPATGIWSPGLPMMSARARHTATPLPNGDVLVAGGLGWGGRDGQNSVLALSELYHPAIGTWSPTGAMATPRYVHTASLIQGTSCAAYCGTVLAVGGLTFDASNKTAAATATVELYTPGLGTWKRMDNLPTAVDGHSVVTLKTGRVLIAGGGNGTGANVRTLMTAWIFDPVQGHWTQAAGMNTPHGGHLAVVLETPACSERRVPTYCDAVLVIGGYIANGRSVLATAAEIYRLESR